MPEDLEVVRRGLRETIAYQCGLGPRPASAQAVVETAGPVSSLGVGGGCLAPSVGQRLWIVKAWGDEITHTSEEDAALDVLEYLCDGATNVCVERRESPAPDNDTLCREAGQKDAR